MNTTGTDATRELAAREVAGRMAAAAAAWLDALDPAQHAVAAGRAPSPDAESDAERRRWFYTPTDHGGLTLGAQRPAQQSLAHQLVASGLSTAGYVTVATIIGLDNVLDQVEGWTVDWGRERGRDPGLYYLRVFGEPGGAEPWGWRFGGHHVSLNNLIADGMVAPPPRASSAPTRRSPRCSDPRRCVRSAGPRTWPVSSSARSTPSGPPAPSCSTGRRPTSSAATGRGWRTATRRCTCATCGAGGSPNPGSTTR